MTNLSEIEGIGDTYATQLEAMDVVFLCPNIFECINIFLKITYVKVLISEGANI
jgi:hypothetical protein